MTQRPPRSRRLLPIIYRPVLPLSVASVGYRLLPGPFLYVFSGDVEVTFFFEKLLTNASLPDERLIHLFNFLMPCPAPLHLLHSRHFHIVNTRRWGETLILAWKLELSSYFQKNFY